MEDKDVLAYLKAKRASIDQAIAALEGKPGKMSSALSDGGTSEDVQPDSFVGMNIATAGVKYLNMVGRPARTTEEIHVALINGGLPDFTRDSVATILHRIHNKNGEIAKVSKGVWGLAEWYPNRPRTIKKRVQEETRDKATIPKGKNKKVHSPAGAPSESHSLDTIAIAWLDAVRLGGTEGLTTQQLATGIGYESGRSLPFIALNINKRLIDLKMEPKTVYEGKKIGKEHRWFAKEKIQDALKALRP